MTTALLPTRRGDRPADRVTVRSVGPLGLAARQGSHEVPWRVRVLPAFTSRRHLPSRLARLRELDGRTAVMVRGQGTEFDSLREYVDGDDVRSIDWRATARAAEVVVRTWRPERDRRVLLVLDSGRTAAGRVGDAPRLDAAMDAALLLAALAARAGDRVDLLAYDRRVRARVEGVTGSGLLPALVTAMAPLDATLVETDYAGWCAPCSPGRHDAALSCCSPRWTPRRSRRGCCRSSGRWSAATRWCSRRSPTPGSPRWRPPAATPRRCTTPPRPSWPAVTAGGSPRCSAGTASRSSTRAADPGARPGRPLPGAQGRRPALSPPGSLLAAPTSVSRRWVPRRCRRRRAGRPSRRLAPPGGPAPRRTPGRPARRRRRCRPGPRSAGRTA